MSEVLGIIFCIEGSGFFMLLLRSQKLSGQKSQKKAPGLYTPGALEPGALAPVPAGGSISSLAASLRAREHGTWGAEKGQKP